MFLNPVAQNILKLYYLNIAAADSNIFTFTNGIRFIFQGDGNFVAYNGSNPVAATASNSPGDQLVLIYQEDGNLVVYSRGKLMWSSHTGGHAARTNKLVIQEKSPYLQIVGQDGKPIYTAKEG